MRELKRKVAAIDHQKSEPRANLSVENVTLKAKVVEVKICCYVPEWQSVMDGICIVA